MKFMFMVVILVITYKILRFLCKFGVRSIKDLFQAYYARREFLENLDRLDCDLRRMELLSRISDEESPGV
ncbi:hypothetical protein [Borrelia puertoricensis]|uniref:hypothetical protein n=1 Tax=Borrelia puertoricensis TaxID=2756107 RepID=UPI001FF1488F|nr:hypothetical protein [Borrelia puertoricensis]UPA18871.1 hypothetical protein bpuSUM_001449 [Borrelia puertoricensis]UPA18908.1 hypothetical protein bpuSUM_001407 [Borrelia puertoricensis]